MERTLVLIKPDCVRRRMVGTLVTAIESTGLAIDQIQQKRLTSAEAGELYKEHKGKWHFERNIRHITSGPTVVIEVVGKHAINKCRELIENFRNNHRDVIHLPRNLVHATSDPDRAHDELSAVGLIQKEFAVAG